MVQIDGRDYKLTSDDDYLAGVGSVFEPDMVRLFRCFAQGNVLDVGANIGCTALALAGMADVVHAFEPSPSTFRFLTTNTSATANIYRHNVGLGDVEGSFELTFAPSNRSGGYVSNHTRASEGHTVEAIEIRSMDRMLSSLGCDRVDFIKIDVEGFEASVLRGGQRTLASSRPVVVLELNHWCLNAFQRTSVPDFLDSLRSIFPRLYAVQGANYLDLHDPGESYVVMYEHILHMRYVTLVGGYEDEKLEMFHSSFSHGR